MKIGILTFEQAINYGTALQAVALQKVLRQAGADASFLLHRCKAVESTSKVFDVTQVYRPAYVLAHLYNLPVALRRRAAFASFWKKHYVMGSHNPYDYDVVVAGSDQIWNYNLTGRDWTYFLDYPKNGKIKAAYAGSFGLSRLDKDVAEKIGPMFADFDYLSVREQTAAALVEQLCGRKVPVVLDPTLLLNRQQWSEVADPTFRHKGYIFVYIVFNSDSLWEYAYELSRKTGLPIRTISYSKLHRRNAEYTFDAGPDLWLSHMLHADYVVTNSFHGFAFSVNFEKQFYYELPPYSSGVGSRLADMAQAYGLTSRELKQREECSIDYLPVRERLEKARKESMSFIKEMIKE